MQAIHDLFAQLPMSANGIRDLTQSVTFINLNVFGRTMDAATNTSGRNHNPNHEVSMMIGPGFNGGVYGGVNAPSTGQTGGDWACMPIDSTTGLPSAGGDILPVNTLASWAKTVLRGVGVPETVIDGNPPQAPGLITGGTTIKAALKNP
jgi:hypothetical protein